MTYQKRRQCQLAKPKEKEEKEKQKGGSRGCRRHEKKEEGKDIKTLGFGYQLSVVGARRLQLFEDEAMPRCRNTLSDGRTRLTDYDRPSQNTISVERKKYT